MTGIILLSTADHLVGGEVRFVSMEVITIIILLLFIICVLVTLAILILVMIKVLVFTYSMQALLPSASVCNQLASIMFL